MTSRESELYCRLHELTALLLEDDASSAARNELQALLHNDQDARRLYVEYIQESASLRWSMSHSSLQSHIDVMATGEVSGPSERSERHSWRRRSAWLALAASALVGIGLYYLNGLPLVNDPPATLANQRQEAKDAVVAHDKQLGPLPATRAVATLTRTAGVQWEGATDLAELSRLEVGQVLALREGQVEMVFDTGVEVVLDGPAYFEIRSAESAYSSRGTISARVGADGKGFTIETPSARVIDLGTEFGVAIDQSGETEVAVFRGIVDLALGAKPKDNAILRRLNQGEAIRVAADGHVNRVISIASDRFPVSAATRSGPVANSPLIADVTDNIREGASNKFYRIVRSGLNEDSPAFVDRNHEWNSVTSAGLPLDLQGAEYIMPFNDDKFYEDLEVSVTISEPANFYVFYSDQMEPPEWLKEDFVDTGIKIGLDEAKTRYHGNYRLAVGAGQSVDTVFNVWKREVLKPGVVRLGAVKHFRFSAGYNMYGIATTPLRDRKIDRLQ